VRGETVRRAERLAATGESGGILVCPRPAAETGDAFPYRAEPAEVPAARGDAIAARALDAALPARRPVVRPSERRQATVLFANVGGLATLYETLPPERLKALLDRCFAELEVGVRSYGGGVDKYVGECLMALFGRPHALQHPPRHAVKPALHPPRPPPALPQDPPNPGRLPAP